MTDFAEAERGALVFEDWWKVWGPLGLTSVREEVARAAWHAAYRVGVDRGREIEREHHEDNVRDAEEYRRAER